jgi:hypothetical protein
VVAVALVAAGFAVVAVLRDGLAGNARLQAESTARGVAAEVSDVDARGVRRLDGLDTDEEPAQVVGPRGKVLGASEELRGRGPLAGFNRVEEDGTPAPDRSKGDDGDDSPAGEDGGATDDGHQNRDRDRDRNRGGDGSGHNSGSGSGDDDSGHGSGSGSGPCGFGKLNCKRTDPSCAAMNQNGFAGPNR